MNRFVLRLLLAIGFAAAAVPASAHKSSDAYLQLSASAAGADLRVDIALRDLDAALDLDADGDSRLTWAEVRRAQPAIERYVRGHVNVDGCTFGAPNHALEQRSDGAYAVLTMASRCTLPREPVVRYTALADVDATHRGLLRIGASGLRVLDPAQPASSATAAGSSFVAAGAAHIVGGIDHVLFLVCLMLPAVMRRARSGWEPVANLKQALLPVVGIVTAFTVAHSITLGLAATRTLLLPAAVIEPAIAATIVLAAIDNLRPIFGARRGVVTFLFGLIHGFGFADVLAELSLPPLDFAAALLKFNLGLELGQLAIVGVAVGVLHGLRRLPQYPALAIRGGSLLACAIGAAWFVERTTDISLLPF